MPALALAGLPHCLPQLGLTGTAVAVALHLCAVAAPQAGNLQQKGWPFSLCCIASGCPWRVALGAIAYSRLMGAGRPETKL